MRSAIVLTRLRSVRLNCRCALSRKNPQRRNRHDPHGFPRCANASAPIRSPFRIIRNATSYAAHRSPAVVAVWRQTAGRGVSHTVTGRGNPGRPPCATVYRARTKQCCLIGMPTRLVCKPINLVANDARVLSPCCHLMALQYCQHRHWQLATEEDR